MARRTVGLPTHGEVQPWKFERNGREVKAGGVECRGAGGAGGFVLAFVPEGRVRDHMDEGSLERVLDDWFPAFPGFHLYYPSRRQPTAAVALPAEAFRHSG